jgi:hypothetical protein
MSSNNSKKSIIIVNGDYNYTNDFIVYNINGNGVVTRQLYK